MEFLNSILYYLFYLFYLFVKFTPSFLKRPILYLFYLFVYYFDFFRKKVVFKNLEIAFPEKSKSERREIAKKFYKNFIFNLAEIIENMNISKDELKKLIEIKGEEFLQKALDSEKPIVFMTAHFGNWEIPPKIVGAFYKPVTILMREFDNKKLGAFFEKNRNSFNNVTLNKKSSAREIIKAFKKGYALGILIDQHSKSDKAETVEFFGKEVKFNRAVSTLSKKFGAIVVPVFTYKEDGKQILEFQEPKTIGDMSLHDFTQWQATVIENMIKRYPSEYYWFHKRFKNSVNYD